MLFSFFISPTFATEITDPATCDSETLSTDTGPTNLRANYESNTLNLKFYDNNTLLDVSSTNSGTCTYGTPINLPTAPTKRGYTFKGWKVVPQYDFTTLDASINSGWNQSKVKWKPLISDGYSMSKNAWPENSKDMNAGEWIVVFPGLGTIYGMSFCSSSSGTPDTTGTPNESSLGSYCWCKATGYKPTGNGSVVYRPSSTLLPVCFGNLNLFENHCLHYCAYRCVYRIPTNSVFRAALYGQSGS